MKRAAVIFAITSLALAGCTTNSTYEDWSKPSVGLEQIPKPTVENNVGAEVKVVESGNELPTQPYYAEDEELIENPTGDLPCPDDIPTLDKPVIYLYGYNDEISVKLGSEVEDKLTCTYPEYKDGWVVNAKPDGQLTDKIGRHYNYLFWEAKSIKEFRASDGWCVRGSDTASFLEEKLAILGLNDNEIDDFITYWLPQMEHYPWNVITFKTDEYADAVPLTVTPAPENTVRILMLWYPWQTKLNCIEPKLNIVKIDRTNPTVVEWGGQKLNDL